MDMAACRDVQNREGQNPPDRGHSAARSIWNEFGMEQLGRRALECGPRRHEIEWPVMSRLFTIRNFLITAGAILVSVVLIRAQTSPLTPDIPSKFNVPTASLDYVKRDVMIPMRDGIKLHTVIVVPNGAKNAPMIF